MKTHYFSALYFVVVIKELQKNLKRFQIFFVKIWRKFNKTFHFFCCFCSVGTLFFIIY